MHTISAIVLVLGGLVLIAGGERIRRGGWFTFSDEARPTYYWTAFIGGVGILIWGLVGLIMAIWPG